jgi:hypothetical protein
MNRRAAARASSLRWAFIVGVIGLILIELANIYFIMPMPGSQRMRSIEEAYVIHTWRWPLRFFFGALVLAGVYSALRTPGWRKWLTPVALLLVGFVAYAANFQMAADHMFRQPSVLNMQPVASNKVAPDRLVVGVAMNGEARAYPLQFIGYHHQVRDTVGGKEVLVSYCTVCRTGRVFSPIVRGRSETFRLVGMDHFNAMFEDKTTKTWWRQANGEGVVGDLKGSKLEELPSSQMRLDQWLALYPKTLIMQGDPKFAAQYSKDYAFERGTSRKTLTGTDTASWRDKSWVVGIKSNGRSKAYDWNRLRQQRIVNDAVGGTPIVLVLAPDNVSYFAFERPSKQTRFALRRDSLVSFRGDSLIATGRSYSLSGASKIDSLRSINASQEFWHSWRTFQPSTERY